MKTVLIIAPVFQSTFPELTTLLYAAKEKIEEMGFTAVTSRCLLEAHSELDYIGTIISKLDSYDFVCFADDGKTDRAYNVIKDICWLYNINRLRYSKGLNRIVEL